MSTLRYSGEIRIRVTYQNATGETNGAYRCYLRASSGETTTIIVRAPAYLTHAVDSPEAFDVAAKAALGFAADDRGDREGASNAIDWASYACFDDGGFLVTRTPTSTPTPTPSANGEESTATSESNATSNV